MNQRTTVIAAALLGALTVMIGAFGAHSLKPHLLAVGKVDVFELATRYQFYHVLALLIVGLLMQFNTSKNLRYASWCFIVGMVAFSGSLYAMCFTSLGILGPLTPLGGVFFILGWIFVALGAATKK